METYTLRPRPDARPDRRYRIDYAGELNRTQYEAATTLEGPVLVIAGAGSGKTRTLVYRVARLVESGVNPGQILLLTFTRKAAEEMLRRAAAFVGTSCERVAGGTFHSFANLVLRRTARHVGLEPTFTSLDRGDSEDVVNLLRSRAGLDRKDRRFPRKGAILEILSMAVNRAKPLADVVTESYLHLAEHLEELERLGLEYARYKREKNLVDYDDLLVLLRDLLRDQPEVAAQLSRTYRFIMVDEYQDTNPLQAEIVRGLAASHPNVMAVGDDSQSFYSFRGATFRNIMDFPKTFPDTRIVKLEDNYRSTQPILDLANAIIDRAAEKHTKVLRTRRAEGPPPLLVQCSDEQAQSRFVCQRILELREEGVPLDEMAVLFRSSFHSFASSPPTPCLPARRSPRWSASTRPCSATSTPRTSPSARRTWSTSSPSPGATRAWPRCSPTWRSSHRRTAWATCWRRTSRRGSSRSRPSTPPRGSNGTRCS